MPRHRVVVVLLAAPLLLGACSDVQDSAKQAASGAASDAATKVADAAAGKVRAEICKRAKDGSISAKDKQVLGGLVSSAEAAGLSTDLTNPLHQILNSDAKPPKEAVAQLQKACAG